MKKRDLYVGKKHTVFGIILLIKNGVKQFIVWSNFNKINSFFWIPSEVKEIKEW